MRTKEYIFLYKYRGPDNGWEPIPEDLWVKIFKEYFLIYADGIGFGSYETKDAIAKLRPFKENTLLYISQSFYYSNNVDKRPISVYQLNEDVFKRVTEFPQSYWNLANPDLDATEIVFFKDSKEVGGLDTSESKLFLHMSEEQKKTPH